MRKHILAQAIALVIGGAVLTGCGGGGSTSPTSTTIDGVAAKGIIKFGKVKAQEYKSDSWSDVGVTTTGEDGSYTLTLSNYAGGPLMLTVEPQTNTVMVCDVQDGCSGTVYGQTIALPNNFLLKAIVPSVEPGATQHAQITPFSDMAAARVLAADSTNDDAINNAISEVNQIVGVNIIETRPIDITNDVARQQATTEQLTYAVFNAAAGQIALENTEGLASGLEKLAQAFEDGKLDSVDSLSSIALVNAVKTQLKSIENQGEAVTAINTQISIIETSTQDGVYNPESSPTPSLTAVEQAKQLVSQARTLGNSVASLEDPALAFKADIDVAAQVIDDDASALITLTGSVIDQVLSALEAKGTYTTGTTEVAIKDNTGADIGHASVTVTDDNGVGISISTSGISSAAISLSLSTNVPLAVLNGDTASLSSGSIKVSGTVSNATTKLSLSDVSLTAAFTQAVTLDRNASSMPEPVLRSMDFAGGIKLEDLVHAMSFTGNASFNLVALNASASRSLDQAPILLSLEKASISGTFAGNGSSFSASAGLNLTNAASFDTFAYLNHEPQMWQDYAIDGDALKAAEYAKTKWGMTSVNNAWYSAWTPETCFSGSDDQGNSTYQCDVGDVLNVDAAFKAKLAASNPNLSTFNPNLQVNEVGFSFSAYEYDYLTKTQTLNSTTWLYGQFELGSFESASYFAQGSLSVNLDLALKGYPQTKALISVNRTELEGGDALVTLLHNGSTVTFKLVKAGTNPTDGTLTVSNPDGVKLIVTGKDGDVSGKVTLADGTQVGTLEKSGNGLYIIRYIDGTFETLQ